MPIRLIVEDYCQNCPFFEPVTRCRELESFIDVIRDTEVTCGNAPKCIEIQKVLKERSQK